MRLHLILLPILLLSTLVLAQQTGGALGSGPTAPEIVKLTLARAGTTTQDISPDVLIRSYQQVPSGPTSSTHTFSPSIFATYIELQVTSNVVAPAWGPSAGQTNVRICVRINDDPGTESCQPPPTVTYTWNTKTAWLTFQITPATINKIVFYGTGFGGTQAVFQVTLKQFKWTGGAPTTKEIPFVELRPYAVSYGTVDSLINTQGYSGGITINSNDTRALAWFDFDPNVQIRDPSRKSTSEYGDYLLVCRDLDKNVKCDIDDEIDCQNKAIPSDWYKGYCCGYSPYNPLTLSPPRGCNWYSAINALCGNTTAGTWQWAGLEDKGIITNLSGACPSIQLVADGTKFYTCTSTTSWTDGIPSNLLSVLTTKTNIEGHEYLCDTTQNLLECGGDLPISQGAKPTGSSTTYQGKANYCTTFGDWRISLDGTNKESCETSGFKWTGTKCCGEPDDTITTYQDTYTGQGSSGACLNNAFIESGEFVDNNQTLINYKGQYYECDPTLSTGTTQTTTNPLIPSLTIQARGPCGTPLTDAYLQGTRPHIICTPSGVWQRTQSTGNHVSKQTKWAPPAAQYQYGCCPDNQCWDGTICRDIGEYYTTGGKGYRCQ